MFQQLCWGKIIIWKLLYWHHGGCCSSGCRAGRLLIWGPVVWPQAHLVFMFKCPWARYWTQIAPSGCSIGEWMCVHEFLISRLGEAIWKWCVNVCVNVFADLCCQVLWVATALDKCHVSAVHLHFTFCFVGICLFYQIQPVVAVQRCPWILPNYKSKKIPSS